MPSRRVPKTTPAHRAPSTGLSDRLAAAAVAKTATLERFRAKLDPNDPAVQERRATLKVISDAREQRAAERRAAKEAEAARLAAEVAARAAEETARRAEERRQADEAARQGRALEVAQKATRDARYAARKARR